jgi:hypothetical protein
LESDGRQKTTQFFFPRISTGRRQTLPGKTLSYISAALLPKNINRKEANLPLRLQQVYGIEFDDGTFE